MRPAAKLGILVGGYLAAVLLATAVVALYVVATDTSERSASSGMYAFGDSLLFLAVFMLASVPSTGLTFHFLRPYRALWAVLSALALVYAATAVPAVLDHWASRHGLPND